MSALLCPGLLTRAAAPARRHYFEVRAISRCRMTAPSVLSMALDVLCQHTRPLQLRPSTNRLQFRCASESWQGSGVAISECLALTALHGKLKVGTTVKVKTARGRAHSAVVVFAEFEADVVDIAVVKLVDKNEKLDCFVPPCMKAVRLEQKIHVIGGRARVHDSFNKYSRVSYVEMIEEGTTLFQATYYNFDSCSGTGVNTTLHNCRFEVVGVHVAVHGATIGIGEKRKNEDISLEQEQADIHSICSDLHGHGAYCLICEIARVERSVEFLKASMKL